MMSETDGETTADELNEITNVQEPVPGLAPFVERALDSRMAREALGPVGSSGPEPRADGGQTGWKAARHAGDRLE